MGKKLDGLAEYHALRRAYVARHGEQPPKGTSKDDLKKMGFKPKKKKKSKKRRKKRRSSSKRSTTGGYDWTFDAWDNA